MSYTSYFLNNCCLVSMTETKFKSLNDQLDLQRKVIAAGQISRQSFFRFSESFMMQ